MNHLEEKIYILALLNSKEPKKVYAVLKKDLKGKGENKKKYKKKEE